MRCWRIATPEVAFEAVPCRRRAPARPGPEAALPAGSPMTDLAGKLGPESSQSRITHSSTPRSPATFTAGARRPTSSRLAREIPFPFEGLSQLCESGRIPNGDHERHAIGAVLGRL